MIKLNQLKPNRSYIVVNCDEPYIKNVFKALRDGEKAKSTWNESEDFEAWFLSTFECSHADYVCTSQNNKIP